MPNWPDKWYSVAAPENPAADADVGVYRVRATESPGKPKPIQRACAVDPEGTVYIGQGVLRDRVGQLLDSKGHAGPHDLLAKFDYYKLHRICPRRALEVQWYETPGASGEEKHLIDEYKKTFGDLPPGNLTLGGEGACSQRP